MPRISAESRSAAGYRAGGKHREPPKHLSARAKEVWIEIAADRPADWFRPGAYELLEQYCEFTVQERAALKALAAKKPTADEYPRLLKIAARLSATLTTLATKLRLSVQADVERHSRKASERGAADAKPDTLLGGTAVWGEGRPARAN